MTYRGRHNRIRGAGLREMKDRNESRARNPNIRPDVGSVYIRQITNILNGEAAVKKSRHPTIYITGGPPTLRVGDWIKYRVTSIQNRMANGVFLERAGPPKKNIRKKKY